MFIIEFLAWSLMLYWIHRAAHVVPWMRKWHLDHHAFVGRGGYKSQWHWNNLLLFNDTQKSTVDLWITEVIPTLLFSAITGAWWLSVLYYLWAALFQEVLEHHPNLNYYPFTAGQWHLVHHTYMNKNYSLFLPLWDQFFKTEYAGT